MLEIVFASNIFGRDDERVDIRARSEDSQAKTAVREHFAPGVFDEDFVLGLLLCRYFSDEFVANLLKRIKDLVSGWRNQSAKGGGMTSRAAATIHA